MLLVFNNGCYDFESGEFRDGRPSIWCHFQQILIINKIDETNKFHKKVWIFWR